MAVYFCPVSSHRDVILILCFFYCQVFLYEKVSQGFDIHRAGVGVGIYVSRLDRVIYKVITPEGGIRWGGDELGGCFQVQTYYFKRNLP